MPLPVRAALAASLFAASAANAQLLPFNPDAPSLDKWMYPFGPPGGREASAPTFGAILIPGFDDRDAEFLVGFNTAPAVPTALGVDAYRIASLSVLATVNSDQRFAYDPTVDSFRSLLPTTDPRFQPDADAGRPVELFAVGFRNGFTLLTYQENSPFGGQPTVPPAEEARNVFPIGFDSAGQPVDVSRQVRLGFDAEPAAVGLTNAVAPGELVPTDTTFTFNLDLCQPGLNAFLRDALNQGRVSLLITSLHPAAGGPGGGTGGNYPSFYTKENPVAVPLGYAAKLRLSVQVYRGGDVDGDGTVDFNDVLAFLNLYNSGSLAADLTLDCVVDFNDFLAFLNLYNP